MSLKRLLAGKNLRRHKAAPDQVQAMLQNPERDLADAGVTAVSIDARFTMAYSSVLCCAGALLAAEGYRARGLGHHETMLKAAGFILPAERKLIGFLDQCRLKRHTAVYDAPGRVTQQELDELLEAAPQFRKIVLGYLARHHPALLAPPAP